MGVCLGSLQLASVRVPAVLSGDDEREGRREGPVRERQLPGSEAGGNFAYCLFYSHLSKLLSSCIEKHIRYYWNASGWGAIITW